MWCLNKFSWSLRNTLRKELIIKKKSQETWLGFVFMLSLLQLVYLFSLDSDSIVLELLLWDSLLRWDREFTEASYRKILPFSRLMVVTLKKSPASWKTIVKCLMELVLNQLDHILKLLPLFLQELHFVSMKSVTCLSTASQLGLFSPTAHISCGDTSKDFTTPQTLMKLRPMNSVMKWFQTSKLPNRLDIWKLSFRNMKTYLRKTPWKLSPWTWLSASCLV